MSYLELTGGCDFMARADILQDGAGWTPLMIAVSLKEGEELAKLFLQKGADVNAKSMFLPPLFHHVVRFNTDTIA